jgi:hypothetical protein
MKYSQVKIPADVDLAINQHLASIPAPPTKQDFLGQLLRLALNMKRIPILTSTKGVIQK